jgi:hypothetical protein
MPGTMPGVVEVLTEREMPGGWSFHVQWIREDGALRATRLALAWQEYDLFCPDGAVPPETVAKAVAEVALELWEGDLPERLDAAALRRRDHGADRRVTERVDLHAM